MEIYTSKMSSILAGISTVMLLFIFLKLFLPKRRRRSLMRVLLRILPRFYD